MSQYVSVEETPAYLLFHTEFHVSIPSAFVRSAHDQKVFGYVSTGDQEYDRQLASAHVQVYRKVPELAELFDLGLMEINVLKPELQVPRMVKLVTDHVAEIAKISNGDYNQYKLADEIDEEVWNDIKKLEAFTVWLLKLPTPEVVVDHTPRGFGAYLQRFTLMQHGSVSNVAKVIVPPGDSPIVNPNPGLTRRGMRRISRW